MNIVVAIAPVPFTVMLPTVQQELEKLFPNTGGGGRGDKRGDLY